MALLIDRDGHARLGDILHIQPGSGANRETVWLPDGESRPDLDELVLELPINPVRHHEVILQDHQRFLADHLWSK